MSLGSLLDFEKFNAKGILKKIRANPERLLLGALDPASTKMWSKVLGKDWKPAVNQMGGATNDSYRDAEAAGIDTSTGKTMHSIAGVVAGAMAGGYGAGQLGGAGAAGTGAAGSASGAGGAGSLAGGVGGTGSAGAGLSAGAVGSGASGAVTATLPTVVVSGTSAGAAGGSLGALGAVGGAAVGGGASAGLSSADNAALRGNDGYGEGMSGSETSAYDAKVGKKFSLQDLQQMGGSMPEQQEQPPPLREDVYQEQDIARYLEGATVPSSRRLKQPQGRGLADAVRRGLDGSDPIDANGVEVVAIKALDKRINDLIKRAEALARRKGVQS